MRKGTKDWIIVTDDGNLSRANARKFTVHALLENPSKNEELEIKNEELEIKNEELEIKNEMLRTHVHS